MPQHRYAYAVTYEAPERRPPFTVRGTVTAGAFAAAAQRAATAARKQMLAANEGRVWDNLVILLVKEDLGAKPTGEAPVAAPELRS